MKRGNFYVLLNREGPGETPALFFCHREGLIGR